MFLPIQHERNSQDKMEGKHKFMWEQLHSRMDQRQREWKSEMEELKKSFFKGTSPNGSIEDRNTSYSPLLCNEFVRSPTMSPPLSSMFIHEFDVKFFHPSEVTVRTQGSKLIVYACHKELNFNKSVSREFKREVDIPPIMDPQSLQCTLTSDGRLVVQSPQQLFSLQQLHSPQQLQSPQLFSLQQLHSLHSSPQYNSFQKTSLCQKGTSNFVEDSLSSDSSHNYSPIFRKEGYSISSKKPQELVKKLPDVVDDHYKFNATEDSTRYRNLLRQSHNSTPDSLADANTKFIRAYKRPFYVDIDLERTVDPTQLKIDAIDKILLITVIHADAEQQLKTWKVHLPRDLDPTEVTAHLTDEGRLILEENIA